MDITVVDDCNLRGRFGLHTVLLLQLLDYSSIKFRILIVLGTRLKRQQPTGVEITVGDDHRSPSRAISFLILGGGLVEAGTKGRNLITSMNLTDAGSVAIRILQHLVDELHLNGLVASYNQIGI